MDTNVLAKRIDEKRQLLVQLLQLCMRQNDLIQAADWNGLMKLLSVKERLLAALQQIERHLDPFRQQDPDSRNWISVAKRLECREAARECELMLERIVGLEKKGESELVRRRDQTAEQLRGTHVAFEARGAYCNDPSPRATQLDVTSENGGPG